ncbi:hypothetical protein R5R35_005933 [Gryllus longicercus]|uniref:PWWP domain-containing protein n=1 Tax=Gryllus longicercus TaxID=2509291 RepID=A0AAN9VAK9_9ORTH
MATAKSSENDYNVRKGEKTSDSNTSSRRAQKSKVLEHSDGSQKKQTRAKTRTALSDDIPPSSVNKAREKGRAVVELPKDGDGSVLSKKEVENSTPPKKDAETVGPPKKDLSGTVSPKKDLGSGPVKKDMMVSGILKKDAVGSFSVKKDVSGSGQPKNGESIGLPKKDVQSLAASKKDVEASLGKSRKFKVKLSSNVSEKKRDDRLNPLKIEETKSEVTTSEKTKNKEDKLKADRRENSTTGKIDEKNHEIMNSDVTSSVDEKPSSRPARNYSPAVAIASLTKEGGWSPGDLAWGRVGQHPFWPCIIAIDHVSGIYTKSKRVGRGLNSVQQSLHVQFFGDNGRHSWIPTSCVIKYEGPDQFHKFAEKVLNEMKKKDKKYSSAFHVKPASKPKWEIAIREAEESVPKAREDRIQFFQDLLPKRKTAEKSEPAPKNVTNGTKSNVQLVKKRNKRPNPITDEKPAKQMKIERQVAIKDEDARKKMENTIINAPTRKKRGRNKN